jgi:hypothetical protein
MWLAALAGAVKVKGVVEIDPRFTEALCADLCGSINADLWGKRYADVAHRNHLFVCAARGLPGWTTARAGRGLAAGGLAGV